MEDVKVCTVLLTPMPSLDRRARKVKNAARKGRTKERASRISSVDLYANIFATVIFAHFATRQAVRRPLSRANHRAAGRTDSWTDRLTQHRKVGLLWIAPV